MAGRCCNLCKRKSRMQIRSKMQYTSLALGANGKLRNVGGGRMETSLPFARTLRSKRKGIQKKSCFQLELFLETVTYSRPSICFRVSWIVLSGIVATCPLHHRSLFYITIIRCICVARSASCWNILLKGGSSCLGLVLGLEYRPSASLITSLTLRVKVLT
jgi:hypothetical protein